MKNLQERFSRKYRIGPATGCWYWTGSKNSSGYGTIKVGHGPAYAHRVSYELYVGTLPKDVLVCHTCDTRDCVNPEHLFLGSSKDNVRDSITKGRWTNKLTYEQATEIRRIHRETRETQTSLGKRFGVSTSAINLIVNNKSYI